VDHQLKKHQVNIKKHNNWIIVWTACV
jgi:hypothetical protein